MLLLVKAAPWDEARGKLLLKVWKVEGLDVRGRKSRHELNDIDGQEDVLRPMERAVLASERTTSIHEEDLEAERLRGSRDERVTRLLSPSSLSHA